MVEPEERAPIPRVRTWCEEKLGHSCLLDGYPEFRNRCLTLRDRHCDFGEMLDTIDRLPLEVRLELLRKLADLQRERLELEFES